MLSRLFEIGYCYRQNRTELTVRLTCNDLNVWQVEVTEDYGDRRRIATRHDGEKAARKALELVYEYGRQFGHWKINRRTDYIPDDTACPVSPAGTENPKKTMLSANGD